MIKKLTIAFLLTLTGATLLGCSYCGLYRPNIQQGNILSQDVVAQLRPGMNVDQVIYLMGSPVLTNTFQTNRLDYVYTFRRGGDPMVRRHLTLTFDNAGILRTIDTEPCN